MEEVPGAHSQYSNFNLLNGYLNTSAPFWGKIAGLGNFGEKFDPKPQKEA